VNADPSARRWSSYRRPYADGLLGRIPRKRVSHAKVQTAERRKGMQADQVHRLRVLSPTRRLLLTAPPIDGVECPQRRRHRRAPNGCSPEAPVPPEPLCWPPTHES
jgi:hypothetical protein